MTITAIIWFKLEYETYFTLSFSFALILSICLAANRLASTGSTMITSFFEPSFPEDTYISIDIKDADFIKCKLKMS
jgi:hypothetical protein